MVTRAVPPRRVRSLPTGAKLAGTGLATGGLMTMRALRAYAKNDPSRLVYEDDAPLPTLAPDDVLLRVHASGVTPSELEWPGTWIDGTGAPRTPPIVPGHEVAGVVEAAGPAVE